MNNNGSSSSTDQPSSLVNPNQQQFSANIIPELLQKIKQLQAAGEKEDGRNELSQLMNVFRLLQQPQTLNLIQQQQQQQEQQRQRALQQQQFPQHQPIAPASNPPQSQATLTQQQQQQQLQLQLLQNHLSAQQQLPDNQVSSNESPSKNQSPNIKPSPPATNNVQPIQPHPHPMTNTATESMQVDDPSMTTSEPPKTMAERLVEAIFHQANEFAAFKKKVMATPALALAMPISPEACQKETVTALDLLSGQQRSHAHASRQQRLLLPEVAPQGFDPYTVLEEREKRIQQRLQKRLAALEASMDEDDQRQPLGYLLNEYYDDTVRTASPERLRTIVQIKSLQLRDKQTKLREEIVKNMEEAQRLANSIDKTSYRKIMKRTMREAKAAEKLEKQQRLDREKKEKQRHLDYLQSVCNQGRDLLSWHKAHQAKMGKLGRAVLQYHAHIEKEEQRRSDKRAKERIKALRNDDEEAYMKLIDEAKDTRLTMLLKQTGAYLESLTQAVVDQKAENMSFEEKIEVDGEGEEEEVDEEMMLTDSRGNKVDYYKMAHRIQEEVSQPSILLGGTLKEYQLKGLQWMVSLYNNHLNGILADEMGLGKTIQTISLITYLIERKRQNGPFLIIVPLSTLTNWTLEFEKWAPSVTTIIYKGTPDVRKDIRKRQIKHRNFQVLLTTFDYIIKDRPALSKIKWQYMIMDEGHRMKNVNSKLTLVLRTYYSSRYRLILTGTPLQNNLPELWALLNFILPKIFNSVKSFEEWFNTPFSNQGVQDKVELNEEEQLLIIKRLHKVLRPFLLRRLKKDVEADLPDKIETVLKCKLSALQQVLYNQMRKHGVLFGGNASTGRTSIKGLNNTIMQLRKICNHPFVFEEVEQVINPYKVSNELLYRVSGKFDLLDRILPKLQATGHRVLIFFQMTQIMDIMEDFCIYRGFRHLRLDGSTKADDRSNLLKLFNDPESPYFIFLLSTRAGGLGLNLQTADTVIIFDSDWNPHQDLQAQDRAHRIGQTKEVRIFRLITEDSVEENILARAQYKLDIDGKVIQAGKFDHRSTEEDREAFLRSLLEDKGKDVDDEESENMESEELDDDELNTILKRSDQEYAIFTKMDLERQRTDLEEWKRRYGDHTDKKPERLIQEWELPEMYRYDQMAQYNNGTDDLVMGRGQRVRETVRYDDGMTERQWLRQIEKDEDETAQQQRSVKRAKYHK